MAKIKDRKQVAEKAGILIDEYKEHIQKLVLKGHQFNMIQNIGTKETPGFGGAFMNRAPTGEEIITICVFPKSVEKAVSHYINQLQDLI